WRAARLCSRRVDTGTKLRAADILRGSIRVAAQNRGSDRSSRAVGWRATRSPRSRFPVARPEAIASIREIWPASLAPYPSRRSVAGMGFRVQVSFGYGTFGSASRGAEAARAAPRLREHFLHPLHSLVPRNNHLCDPVAGMDGVRFAPQI